MRYEIHGQSLTCHSPKATKANADTRRKAQLRATVLDLARQAGKSDGLSYAICVACGMAAVAGATPGSDVELHMGHVVPDVDGGVWCPCNIVPMCGKCNRDLSDNVLTEWVEPVYDTRDYWAGMWAPKPRNSREVRRPVRGAAGWDTIHPASIRLRCEAEEAAWQG